MAKHHNARIITATNQQNWSMLPAAFVDHTNEELITLESLNESTASFLFKH